MHLVLTGATGLVGSAVLQQMLTTPSVTRISILSRRAVPQAEGHSKAHVILHKDFKTYPSELLSQLKDVDGVVWAQGISVTQVSKEEYKDITITYPLNFVHSLAATTNPKPLNFVYISGQGASIKPGRFTAYFGIIKGQAESALLALPSDPAYGNVNTFSVRPSAVDHTFHQEIHQWVPVKTGVQALTPKLLPALRWLMPSIISPTRELADVAVALATGKIGAQGSVEGKNGDVEEGRIITHTAIPRLAALL